MPFWSLLLIPVNQNFNHLVQVVGRQRDQNITFPHQKLNIEGYNGLNLDLRQKQLCGIGPSLVSPWYAGLVHPECGII